MPFHFFIRLSDGDFFGQSGELDIENLLGGINHDLSSRTGGGTAHDDECANVIEVRVVSDGIAKAGADGLVNLSGAFGTGNKTGELREFSR